MSILVIVNTPDQARRFLDEAAQVAEPIQRGDQPYAFTLQKLRTALDKAAALWAYAYRILDNAEDPAAIRASDFIPAAGYADAIAEEILRTHHPNTVLKETIEEVQRRINFQRLVLVDKMTSAAA